MPKLHDNMHYLDTDMLSVTYLLNGPFNVELLLSGCYFNSNEPSLHAVSIIDVAAERYNNIFTFPYSNNKATTVVLYNQSDVERMQ